MPMDDTVELEKRPRARDLGLAPGILAPGPLNAITDVGGVRVGHVTLVQGEDVRTGATVIVPHDGNVYQDKVPAGLAVGNGYGKLVGATQIIEMGEIETPIALTNTLAVSQAAEALLDWTLDQGGNEEVLTANPIVGETNDGVLNNIRRRTLMARHVLQAIESAATGPVAEGAVGAGTGTVAFGWKGGIGSSSRRLLGSMGGYTVGVLVQSNFDGVLQMGGLPVGQILGQHYLRDDLQAADAQGSIMIVVATDAPLSDRNLRRLAWRAMAGLARTGASMSNGSGDYALAFSIAEGVRRTPVRREGLYHVQDLANASVSPLFQAAIEATQEAIYNSLLQATTTTGYQGVTVHALPIEHVAPMLARGE